MLCCGVLAVLATAVFGAWRRLRGIPCAVLVLAGGVLVADPVAALTTGASAQGGMIGTQRRVLAISSLCGGGGHGQKARSIDASNGE
jgi:hypothetical protein